MSRIGNSLSVLLLAQSQMLQPGMVGAALGDTNDAAPQAFGLMSRELGRLLSTLVVTRRQVWLAQAPISDDCRQSLRRLPVVQGQLFGPEAERALECRWQSSQAPEAWGGRSGAMGPPAPQPRRRDVRDPRRQFRTGTSAQFALWRELGGSPGGNGYHLGGLWWARTGAGAPPEAEAGCRGRPEGCRLTAGRFSQRHLAYWEKPLQGCVGVKNCVPRVQASVLPSASTPIGGQGDPRHRSCTNCDLAAGNKDSAGQGGHSGGPTTFAGRRVLLNLFPDSKEGWFPLAGVGPQGAEPLFEGAAILDAPHLRLPSGNLSRRVVYIRRPEGRVLPCSNPPRTQEASAICLPRRGLRVFGPAIRPFFSPSDFHEVHEGGPKPSVP
ncbi:hypothetical protein ATANTOWER_000334, partial [Ataeniobius toweri]|nr:hypothetical protein [Ataeniobius toweri]